MNNKHRKTLEAIFQDPVNGSLEWARIEAFLVAVGCRIIEGNGSSLSFEKPASGRLLLRIAPTVHAAAVKAAAHEGQRLNKWVAKVLAEAATHR